RLPRQASRRPGPRISCVTPAAHAPIASSLAVGRGYDGGVSTIDAARRRTLRQQTAWISLAGGVAIFLAKMAAWRLTGSSAVLSDGLESTVNVVASLFALFALRYAAQPADRDHPYGHGKIEFVSAAFEGGL